MKRDDFADLMNRATVIMNNHAKAGMPGYSNAQEFEKTVLARAFCKTQANSSSDIASLHDDWILVSTLHDSLDLAAKFRPDSTKNPFKPSKRV